MIPEEQRKFFWDTDPLALDEERHNFFIIERLLELGDDDAIRWVVRKYPGEAIMDVLRNSRRLSPRTANLWRLYYGLRKDEIRCMNTPSVPLPGM